MDGKRKDTREKERRDGMKIEVNRKIPWDKET